MFETEIVDIRLHSRADGRSLWQVSLLQTEFRSGDTGVLRARAKSGASIEIAVIAVDADEEGVLWHMLEKPLLAGTAIVGSITGAR